MRFGVREMIFMLLLLSMPLAAYFFVFEPRNRLIADARAEIQAKQAKLKQLEQATMSMPDLGAEIDRLTQTIQVFEEKLPKQNEVDELLRDVSTLATRQRLLVRSVRPDKPVEKPTYNELPIKMKIEGDFDSFYQFMLELEKLNRITRLPRLKLKKITREDANGQVQADMELTVFYEPRAASNSAG